MLLSFPTSIMKWGGEDGSIGDGDGSGGGRLVMIVMYDEAMVIIIV